MPKTTADIYGLAGVEGGIAFGDAQTEQDALEASRAAAAPEVVISQARDVTTATLEEMSSAGVLPETPEERRDLAAEIADAALDRLTVAAADRVSFHERAAEIAAAMPDVHVFSGPGFTNLYVACKADGTGWDAEAQALLDALADPDSHKERCFQHYAPDDIVALALEARTLGADVVGDGSDTDWTLAVNGKPVTDAGALGTLVEGLRP